MNEIFHFIGSLVISFIVVFYTIPVIIKGVRKIKLYDKPNERSVTNQVVPTLGGLAIFFGFTLASILASNGVPFEQMNYIFAGVIILLFIGLKDDILIISPWKKFIAEVLVALVIIIFANIRFTSLHGFMGIYEISYGVSVLLTVFVVIVVINALNLIDGVDGLASGLGLIISATFGIWFYLSGHYAYTILSFALIGSLAAYFYFNVFSTNKIFMGDTGSLILGFIISVLVIRFNECNITQNSPYTIEAAPAVSIGILMVPLFDTLRVFVLRITKKISPFHPDKNHIHHLLLDLNMSHLQVTLVLLGANIFFIILSFIFNKVGIFYLVLIHLSIAVTLSLIIDFLSKKAKRKT